MNVPTSIGSRNPLGVEIALSTFDQLEKVNMDTRKTKARNFKQNLLDLKNKHGVEVNQRVVDDCRPNAEETVVNKWIIDAQCELLRCLVAGKSYSPGDFGYPVDKDAREAQVFEGNMPSIKRSKETIMAHSPKKGANMHDTPPKPLEY